MQMKHYPTIDLEATGRQIIRLRKAKGLSVRDLQQYFGFDAPQAIYKWQKGQTLPSVDNLYALSILLEVPMNTILVQVNRPRLERQDNSCRPVFFVWGSGRCDSGRLGVEWKGLEITAAARSREEGCAWARARRASSCCGSWRRFWWC